MGGREATSTGVFDFKNLLETAYIQWRLVSVASDDMYVMEAANGGIRFEHDRGFVDCVIFVPGLNVSGVRKGVQRNSGYQAPELQGQLIQPNPGTRLGDNQYNGHQIIPHFMDLPSREPRLPQYGIVYRVPDQTTTTDVQPIDFAG